jgi:hypothetical protein
MDNKTDEMKCFKEKKASLIQDYHNKDYSIIQQYIINVTYQGRLCIFFIYACIISYWLHKIWSFHSGDDSDCDLPDLALYSIVGG